MLAQVVQWHQALCPEVLEDQLRMSSVSCLQFRFCLLLERQVSVWSCLKQRYGGNIFRKKVRWMRRKAGTLGQRVMSFFNHAECFLWCSGQVSVYCAGFPCTPFSMLHYATQLLQDPNARQLLKVIANCRVMEPGVSWHEMISIIDEISHLVNQI